MRKFLVKALIFILTAVPILSVILALFFAPLKAENLPSNIDPPDWEIIVGGFSEEGTQLLPSSVAVWTQSLPDGCAVQTRTLNKKALRTWTVDGDHFDDSGLSISEYLQQGPSFYAETNLLWVDNIINDGSFGFDPDAFRVRGWSDERIVDVDMFGEEWERTHYNNNPLSFFLGSDGYLYYSEDYWHEFPSLGREPPTGNSAIRVSKANATKPNPRVFFGAANSSDTINRTVRWSHFTEFYPVDCDFSIDDDEDGTLNWVDIDWLDANSPVLTTPNETVVCPERFNVCIDWSDCETDFDGDGFVNCNDYSVSDPTIWEICQIEEICNEEESEITDLETENEREESQENDPEGGTGEKLITDPKEIQEESALRPLEITPKMDSQANDSEIEETGSNAEDLPESSSTQTEDNPISDNQPETLQIDKVGTRSVLIGKGDVSLTLNASGDERINVVGTTLNIFSETMISISGTGFLPNSSIEFYVYSDPIFLGTVLADIDGGFELDFEIPTILDPGIHTFEASGSGSDQSSVLIQYEFVIIDSENPKLFQEIGLFDEPEESAKIIGGLAAIAAAIAAAGAAGAAAGSTGSSGGSGSSSSSSATAHRAAMAAARGTKTSSSSDQSENVSDDEVESLEIRHDIFFDENSGWGDRLSLWKFTFLKAFDAWWPFVTTRCAPISPLVSKVLNDGSYLRAGLGSVWICLPILSATSAFWALTTSLGPVGEPGASGLTAVMVIGMFDIFSGLFGMTVIAIGYIFLEATNNDIGVVNDIRFIIGLFSLGCGPAILATSIRKVRKPAARTINDWWERAADLAVGTFITGWITIILITVLSQYTAIGLKFETNSNKVAFTMTLAFIARLILEETTARIFPKRLNQANPTHIPEQGPIAKWISIVNRAIITLFLSVAFVGNCWQLWVGLALFTIPSLVDQFKEYFPNFRNFNRYLPQETPTLTLVEICIVGILGILIATIGGGATLVKTGFMLFPIPPILISIGNALGRESIDGKGTWYLEPKYVQWYRFGGVILLFILVYLSEIFGVYFPMFL